MRDRLGFSPTDGVAIVTGSSSGSTSSGGISSSSGAISSSSTGISGSSSSVGGSSSSSRTRVKLRQRVAMPKMWLGEPGVPLFGQIKG